MSHHSLSLKTLKFLSTLGKAAHGTLYSPVKLKENLYSEIVNIEKLLIFIMYIKR